ncbi:MAG: hypothetical protein RLZ04_2002 [Actinomycetota bacterium]
MKRWLPAGAAAAVLAAVVFAGFSGGGNDLDGLGQVDNSSLTVPATTQPGVVIGTGNAIVKTNLSQPLNRGMSGIEVTAMQQRLHDLGFDPGPVDGMFGGGTEQALWAFEGLIGNARYDQQAGILSNELWQRMQDDLLFQPRRQSPPGNTHVEVYLDLQVLIVFKDNKPVLITHISSGELDENGEPKLWCELVTYDTDQNGVALEEPVTRDECAYAKTPGGVFRFNRKYDGKRLGPLGGMYNPVYFNYGIAVHGAENVPNKPASHGCIRIPNWVADYFPSLVELGDYIFVWNGKKEPEDITEEESLPSFNFRNPDSTYTTTSSTSPTTTTKPVTTTTKPATTTTKPATTTTRPATTTTLAP